MNIAAAISQFLVANAATIVLAVVILAALVAGIILARRAIRAKREFSQMAFGTDSITEGLKRQEYAYEHTPRSLSDVSRLYLPKIHEDFPEFDLEDACSRASGVLTSYLMAIDAEDAKLLKEGAFDLKEELRMRIAALKDAGQREQYENVQVHRAALSGYKKADGLCTITIQAAVQYRYGLFDETGKVLAGRPDDLSQERYELDLCYVQDPDKVAKGSHRSLALNCPNCGAPLTSVGALKCAYCGTPVIPVNRRAWQFLRVRKD